MTINISKHAQSRHAMRGITPSMIDAAISFGDTFRSNGSLYYFLGDRARKRMLKVFKPQNPDKFLGLVVVCDPTGLNIITSYKNSGWPKQIRHKRS